MDAIRSVGLVLETVRQQHGNASLAAAYTAIESGCTIASSRPTRAPSPRHSPTRASRKIIEQSKSDEIAAAVSKSHAQAQALVGQESGSPILSIDGGPGYFCPVVAPIPAGDEADMLFDAVVLISQVPAFSELKRARESF